MRRRVPVLVATLAGIAIGLLVPQQAAALSALAKLEV